MRVLLVIHVGETLGHLIRGVEVADALRRRGATVTVAASAAAGPLLDAKAIRHVVIPWGWSHNDMTPRRVEATRAAFTVANAALLDAFSDERPDLVLGFPGIFSCQAARHAGLAHVSVVHGVYLSGAVDASVLDAPGKAVISHGVAFFERQATRVWRHLEETLGLPALTYADFLEHETLAVADPYVTVPDRPNRIRLDLIRGSYGAPPRAGDAALAETCVVTFGSGNPCDLQAVVDAAARHFTRVLVCGWHGREAPRVTYAPPTAHAALAGRVAACASHGGLGTIATFGAGGTPQLVIPTEIDQATTAVHVTRAGVALATELDAWRTRAGLGRRLDVSERDLDRAFAALAARGPGPSLPASGAAQLATLAERHATVALAG